MFVGGGKYTVAHLQKGRGVNREPQSPATTRMLQGKTGALG